MSKQDKQSEKKGGKAGRRAKALELAAGLNGDARKKDWKKVARLLEIDCCHPDKRKCKGCPLAKELERA